MLEQNDPYLITVSGSPLERGQQHGESCRGLIQEGLRRYHAYIGDTWSQEPQAFQAKFLQDTQFLPAIQQWTPDLLEELHGIAEGAGVDFDDLYAYNLFDELGWYIDSWNVGLQAKSQPLPGSGCSAIGAYDQPPFPNLIAKNNDLLSYFEGTAIVLHIIHPDSDLETLVSTPAGILGHDGLNSLGIGVCVNNMAQMRHSITGLPNVFIIRGILQHTFLDGAVKFVKSVPHATGMNYMLGSPVQVVDLEASVNKVVEIRPRRDSLIFYHTNHPILSDDYDSEVARTKDTILTQTRYAYLEETLSNWRIPLRVSNVRKILSNRDVPISFERTYGDGQLVTCMSTVMELKARPVLHWTPGPPSCTPNRVYSFE